MSSQFHNMVHYAKTNMKTFKEDPFNEVDSLIFSWLCYLYIHQDDKNTFSDEGMPIHELLKAEYFNEMFLNTWSPEETMKLLVAVIASPRYRDTIIRYYRNEMNQETNLQFSAFVYTFSSDCHYIAYRGTDWSITGWKEDILLALKNPLPSQKKGLEYLNTIGAALEGNLIVGGHSKGGNLAVYCAANCDQAVQDRILNVYSHDGPGFLKEELEKEGFLRIKSRIKKTIPHFSIFGMLFECETKAKIIESNGIAIMQHNPVSWRVEDGRLYEISKRSGASVTAIDKMNRWISGLTDAEKIVFIQSLFEIIDALGASTINEIGDKIIHHMPEIMFRISKMDKDRRKFMLYALRLILFNVTEKSSREDREKKNAMELLAENLAKEGNLEA